MRLIFLLISCCALTSCANSQSKRVGRYSDEKVTVASSESNGLGPDFGRDNELCFSEWEGLIDEWRSGGGGFKRTMLDTRNFVEGDSSGLSVGIRFSWKNQDEAPRKLEGWPVDPDEFRRVVRSTWDAFVHIVSDECNSVTWLGPLFWNEVRGGGTKGVRQDILTDMPSDLREDPTLAANWIIYNLFKN